MNRLATLARSYSWSTRTSRPGPMGTRLRVSRVNCLLVSSRQTRGRARSWARVVTSSTSSIAATKAALALGGITQ